MNYRNNNPLDFLITRQGQLSDRTKSPRRITNNQHYNTQPQYQHQYDLYPSNNPGIRIQTQRTMSPNKLVAKGKPLLSPRQRVPFSNAGNFNNNALHQVGPIVPMIQSNRYNSNGYPYQGYQNNVPNKQQQFNFKSPRSQSQVNNSSEPCMNHLDRFAEFGIDTDDGYQFYCKMCAARLAAQGFPVVKLSLQQGANKNKKSSRGRKFKRIQIPNFPQYQGNKIYDTIIQFLKEMQTVEGFHIQNYKKFQSIQQHYNNQLKLVEQFYDNLKEILQNMRGDHLQDLREFKLKHTQEADIYLNDLNESMTKLNEIANDTIINIEDIVTKLYPSQQQTFWNYLKQNRNIVRMARHQVQNQRDMLKDVPDYTQEKLQSMVKQYQTMLTSLWQQQEQRQQVQKNNHSYNNNKNENFPRKSSQNQKQPYPNININVPQKQPLQYNHNNANMINMNSTNVHHHQQKKMNIKQIHNNLPKNNNHLTREFEGKSACRVIFDDNQAIQQISQNLDDKVSPKFKVI